MSSAAIPAIAIFGEVLFDHFPYDGRVLGGAPFNVAWHLQAFGQQPLFISRLGDDEEGQLIIDAMSEWGLSRALLQRDGLHATGAVTVSFDNGEPRYAILDQQAYDYIDAEALKECQNIQLLYHGTLACRHAPSRAALLRLLEQTSGLVFMDVNLRTPWWSKDEVLSAMRRADWVKLNDHELAQLWPGSEAVEAKMQAILGEFQLQGVLVTCGEQGALALDAAGQWVTVKPEMAVEVVDTVGAGDAFAAVMIIGIVKGWSLQQTMARAQVFASALVGQRGATVSDSAFYQRLMADWR